MKTRPFGLPKAERLLKPSEFSLVFKEGRRVSYDGLGLCFLANKLKINRIGISIPPTIYRHSTKRNRIKRLIKEAYRKNKDYFKKGFDLVFVTRRVILDCSYNKIQDKILYLAKKADLAESKDV